jgi:hypothetical protein
MEKVNAVIEEASIHNIFDLFTRKPVNLKFNETDAIIITAKTDNNEMITQTFYFCLKPDGTFDDETIAVDGSRSRRHHLASFIIHYGITDKIKGYNIKERIGEWKGKTIEVLLPD